ncbi:hypothetical protein SK069_05345 [Patulibacter brassicae]|uniref:FAD-binding FR-type domain-containing protein n=1 Tax=Patulibacter brassicae TaxID=1705717 RepID=A0ABU4VJC3_9ACTN|nr:hypothetical protein [Patulibacter brassicae]MDX8151008.1 hypothetical protein [Patulibacter brassicae]
MQAAIVPPALTRALAPLDQRLGRIGMHRFVLLVLAVLVAVALVLSIVGELAPGPGDVLASLAVALGVALAVNAAFCRVLRAAWQPESTLITGLLLFFLFTPTTDGGALLDLALVAAVASTSKYVLAVRGRHVLNPAAAGAALATILQLGAIPTWWVAGVELRWFVVVALLLVVVRLRQGVLVGVFVLLATANVVSDLDAAGTGFGDALEMALTSYPILFLAAFMLTEPLTLPPRRWQRVLVAAVVAFLFASPTFHVGDTYMTPEIALLLGNVLAFGFGQLGAVRLRHVGSEQLGPTTWEHRFAPGRPVRFRPGQYAELVVPHGSSDARGQRRMLTIASAPGGEVAFGVRHAPRDGSAYKAALAALEPGATLRASLVAGDFVLPRDAAQPLLLVAGGIGITPFVSQLRAMADDDGERDLVLVYGVSAGEGVPYADRLPAVPGLRVVVVAPADPGALPAGWRHVAGERLDAATLEAAAPDLADRRAFVSGPPAMVDAVAATLRARGARRVHTDQFAGY